MQQTEYSLFEPMIRNIVQMNPSSKYIIVSTPPPYSLRIEDFAAYFENDLLIEPFGKNPSIAGEVLSGTIKDENLFNYLFERFREKLNTPTKKTNQSEHHSLDPRPTYNFDGDSLADYDPF